jgi:hypothetical protein
MGRSTSSEICPNVAFLDEFGGLMQQERDVDELLVLKAGWQTVPLSQKSPGHFDRFGELYLDTFKKGALQVHLVNTALYSNGGEEDWAVFSNDEMAVQTFLADHGIVTQIHKQESVHQTL